MKKLLAQANHNHPLDDADRLIVINRAAVKYGEYLDALSIDWRNDPHSADTPMRVAKAFVNDIAKGCYMRPPIITAFDNTERYDGIIFQGNIELKSLCSHHHLAFTGKAHVAYIPHADGKIIGLSKLNRIVDFFARRPQVQESLTMQVFTALEELIGPNQGIAVHITAQHTCCSQRGIGHHSTMKTSKLSGYFFTNEVGSKDEFDSMINSL